jgi:putative transposase
MIDVPPPGFRGLCRDLPVTVYSRHLPHWRQEGATYFVTFRLADSLPQAKLAQLREERDAWRRLHPEAGEEERDALALRQMVQVEDWLDAGHGCCVLGHHAARTELKRCLLFFDRDRYDIGAFAIPSNHVHVVAKPLNAWPMEKVDGDWKQHSAKRINDLAGIHGKLWQSESFDRIVRDTTHLRAVIGYLEGNIAKGNGVGSFWLRSDWHEWYYGCGDGSASLE